MYQTEQIITLVFLISILLFTLLNINPSSIFLPIIIIFDELTSIVKVFGIIVFIIFIFISMIALWELVFKRFMKNTSQHNDNNHQTINVIILLLLTLFISSFIISSFKTSSTKTHQTFTEDDKPKKLLKSYPTESNSFQLFIAIFSLFLILILSSSMKEDFRNWKKERKLKKLAKRSKLTNQNQS